MEHFSFTKFGEEDLDITVSKRFEEDVNIVQMGELIYNFLIAIGYCESVIDKILRIDDIEG